MNPIDPPAELPCQRGDPDRFFPSSGWSVQQVEAVKTECHPCPVRESCLDWALRHGEQGIWAGTSDKERKRIRHARHIKVQLVHFSIRDDRTDIVGSLVARGLNGPQIAAATGLTPSGAALAIARVKRHAS